MCPPTTVYGWSANSAGLDWAACADALEDPAMAERVEANTNRLLDLDHWGVPVFVFDGELYWGQDRIEDVERALSRPPGRDW